jgi:hypothetical protein
MTVRPSAGAFLVVGCLTGSALLVASGPHAFGPPAEAPERVALSADSPDAGDLDRRLAAITAQSRAKDELVRDLIAGKSSFRDVTAKFMAMNADSPGHLITLRGRFPGLTDEQVAARNVLEAVELFAGVPADEKSALARLDGDFTREYGPLQPPDSGRMVAGATGRGSGRIDRRQLGPKAVWRALSRSAKAVRPGADRPGGTGDARPPQ